MFCAYGDRAALTRLGTAMAEIATSPDRVRALVAQAESAGFVFHGVTPSCPSLLDHARPAGRWR